MDHDILHSGADHHEDRKDNLPSQEPNPSINQDDDHSYYEHTEQGDPFNVDHDLPNLQKGIDTDDLFGR